MFLGNKFNCNFENVVPGILVMSVCIVLTFSDKGVVLYGQQHRMPNEKSPKLNQDDAFYESLCSLWGLWGVSFAHLCGRNNKQGL